MMARPRLPIGTFGEVRYLTTKSGTVSARVDFRDWDGAKRLVQASGATQAAAERALKIKVQQRIRTSPQDTSLTPDSTFTQLVEYWLEDIELEDRLAPATRDRYAYHMRQLVLPAFSQLTLREIGVARCDTLIKQLAHRSYNRARQAKVVLRLAFGLAVRHEVISRNPMDGIARLHKPPHTPDALSPEDVEAIRLAVALWERGVAASGPKPDGQLSAIIEVMLGTSARIGEALALRRCDVDIAGPRPVVSIRGTICTPRGVAPYRQDHPKTAKSRRTMAVPSFTRDAIRLRLATVVDLSPEALLFCSRNGTPLTMANVRRQLRHVMDLAGIEGVTPHKFRRTVATAINDAADVDLAAELLGHTDSKITIQHYIRRNEMVNPRTADLLEAAFSGKH
jgi:integrase